MRNLKQFQVSEECRCDMCKIVEIKEGLKEMVPSSPLLKEAHIGGNSCGIRGRVRFDLGFTLIEDENLPLGMYLSELEEEFNRLVNEYYKDEHLCL